MANDLDDLLTRLSTGSSAGTELSSLESDVWSRFDGSLARQKRFRSSLAVQAGIGFSALLIGFSYQSMVAFAPAAPGPQPVVQLFDRHVPDVTTFVVLK